MQVHQLAEEIKKKPARAVEIFQDKLLAGFVNNKVGRYSMYHDVAVYALGLDSPKTIRLAHMYVIKSVYLGFFVLTKYTGSTTYLTLESRG